MKVWITKYALTSGIFTADIPDDVQRNSGFVSLTGGGALYRRSERHESEEAAVAKAEDMRSKKIASLWKQIAALEKLEFWRERT
jgi:hypothetical protein